MAELAQSDNPSVGQPPKELQGACTAEEACSRPPIDVVGGLLPNFPVWEFRSAVSCVAGLEQQPRNTRATPLGVF